MRSFFDLHLKIKVGDGENDIIPYPSYMYQLILQKQLDLAYYGHIPLSDSDKLPICDFDFMYEELAQKIHLERDSKADELILLSQAVRGAKLSKKNKSNDSQQISLPQ